MHMFCNQDILLQQQAKVIKMDLCMHDPMHILTLTQMGWGCLQGYNL